MIDPILPVNERIQLITSIFSDLDEVEVFKHLSRDDAQIFVNVIDEASISLLLLLEKESHSNFL